MVPVKQSNEPNREAASLNQEWFRIQSKAEFIEGAPHLKHPQLRKRCNDLARDVFEKLPREKGPPMVFDMGAGDGTLTVPYLQLGANVMAADVTIEFLE